MSTGLQVDAHQRMKPAVSVKSLYQAQRLTNSATLGASQNAAFTAAHRVITSASTVVTSGFVVPRKAQHNSGLSPKGLPAEGNTGKSDTSIGLGVARQCTYLDDQDDAVACAQLQAPGGPEGGHTLDAYQQCSFLIQDAAHTILSALLKCYRQHA